MVALTSPSTTNRRDNPTLRPAWGSGWLRSLVIFVALLTAGFLPAVSYAGKLSDLDVEPEFYLMDVRLGNFMLAEAAPAYLHQEQLYLDFEIFLEALEFQIKRDGAVWSGWFRQDDHRFSWSMNSGQLAISNLSQRSVFSADWLESEEGIFVSTKALEKWFTLDLLVDKRLQILGVDSADLLPFQQRMARDSMKRRYRAAKSPDVDVKVPDQYQWFTVPMFDLSTYIRGQGNQDSSATSNTTSVTTAMDLLKHSVTYNGTMNTDSQSGFDSQNRMTVERNATTYEGAMALGMTQYAFGDVYNTDQNLITRGGSGSGFSLSRGRSGHSSNLGRTTIAGNASPGWDVELYRNSTLLELSKVDRDGRYTFVDQETGYGENIFVVKLYGPQGQVREQRQIVWGGSIELPPGDYEYSISHIDYTRRFLDGTTDRVESLLAKQTTDMRFSYGVTEDLQIGAGYTQAAVASRNMPGESSTENYMSVLARTNIMDGLLQAELVQQVDQGHALELEYLTTRMGQTIGFEHRIYSDFESPRTRSAIPLNSESRIGVSGPLQRDYLRNYSVSLIQRLRQDGLSEYRLSNRLGMLYKSYSLANELDYVQVNGGSSSLRGKFRMSGRRGGASVRAELDYSPTGRHLFNQLSSTVSWDMKERWHNSLSFSQGLGASGATRVDYVLTARYFGMDISLALGASTESTWSIGLGINSYLGYDKRYGGFTSNRRSMAGTGRATFNLFIDRNGNSRRDSGEPLVESVSYNKAGGTTVAPGTVAMNGLPAERPLRIDTEDFSFEDPFLVPKQRIYELYTHAGSNISVDISVVETGDIEGYIYRNGKSKGLRGVDVALYTHTGEEVARTRSSYDGYYMFDLVPAGEYEIRLTAASGEELVQHVTLEAEEGYALMDDVYIYQ